MIFPEYVEKKNIEEFLQENAFNQVCYKKILENETFKHRIDPLRFFNHLWYLHLLVMSNKNKPEKILDFIKKMHLPDEEEFLLLWDLDISFKKTIDPCITNEFSDIDLDVCLEWLDKEMIQLGHKIFAEDFEKEFLFNIETVLTNLKFYPNYQDKLIYLYNMKAKYENYAFSDDENKYFKFGELLDKITIDTLKIIKYCLPKTNVNFVNEKKPGEKYFEISEYIERCFPQAHSSGWKYFFLSLEDFRFVINIIARYFSGNEVDFNFQVELKSNCKTLFCMVMNKIFKHCSENHLKNESKFLQLLGKFSVFKGLTEIQIYEAVIKNKLD